MTSISATQITTYLMCAQKYRYRYVDGIPPAFKSPGLAFGSSVHSALEWFHEELLAGNKPSVQEVVQTFKADWASALEDRIRFEDGEREYLPDIGQKLIEQYIQKAGDLKVQAVEKPFEVKVIDPASGEVTDLVLKGYWDLVLEGEIRELKTSATSYNQSKVDQLLQLDAYAFAYRELYGKDPALTVVDLVKTKTPKVVSFKTVRERSRDLWFCKLALEIAKGVRCEVFPANPGWMCAECEYGEMCGEVGREAA